MDTQTNANAPFDIASAILTYLLEYPAAHDTLEGIVEWWLLEQEIKFGIRQVREALAQLVAHGFVHERKSRDKRTHYHVNQQRLEDIRLFLDKRFNRFRLEQL